MKKKILVTWTLSCLCVLFGYGQTDTVFWFAAPDLAIDHQQVPVQFCFTTYDSAATITVEQPTNSAFPTSTFTVPANGFHVLDVSNWVESIESKPANTVLNRGFRISSTAFISCYYESVGNNSEMYTLKGSSGLGTDFLVPMQTTFDSRYSSSTSSIEIMATENNTVVEITAPVALQGGVAAGTTVTVTLQQGQSYVVRSSGTGASAHLHNTTIHSNKPIVVNSTDDSVASGQGCVDLIGEQIVPISMIGSRYVAIRNYSSYTGNFERVYVFPVHDSTTVWFNGVSQTVLLGDYINYQLTDTATLITSDQPVAVFQITATGCEQGGTMLPHLECTGSYSVSHLRPNIASMIVTLVTETAHVGNFTLNGSSTAITAADFHPLAADPTLSYCLKDISNIVSTGSVMTLTNSSGRFQLGILDGDNGGSCSYGFFSDYARSSYVRIDMDSIYCQSVSIPFLFTAPNMDDIVVTCPNGLQITSPPYVLTNPDASMTGWYYVEGVDTASCFSVFGDSLYISFWPGYADTTWADVCQGMPYQNGEFDIPAEQTSELGEFIFEHNYTTSSGHCDSSFVLVLTVHSQSESNIEDVICEGAGYTSNGFLIPKSQTVGVDSLTSTLSLQTEDGCDSVIHLRLSIIDTSMRVALLTEDFCEAMSAEMVVTSPMPDFVWSTGETTPNITVYAPGLYSVTATQGDCWNSARVVVKNCQSDWVLPNVITTSNADGLNDHFAIPELNQREINLFEISIFNRWGEMVFYSTDKNFKWYGDYRGEIHPQTVYNYVIEYTDSTGRQYRRTGSITVL